MDVADERKSCYMRGAEAFGVITIRYSFKNVRLRTQKSDHVQTIGHLLLKVSNYFEFEAEYYGPMHNVYSRMKSLLMSVVLAVRQSSSNGRTGNTVILDL
jgi:hypothetical protein